MIQNVEILEMFEISRTKWQIIDFVTPGFGRIVVSLDQEIKQR